MYDFPTTPAPGTVVTTPSGSYRVWDGEKWQASPSPQQVSLSAFIDDRPPAVPQPGQLWFDSSNPQLYIFYDDPTGPGQWVIVTAYAGGLTSDAPSDGQLYGRQNGAWSNISGGGSYLPLIGGQLSGPLVLPNGTLAAPSLAFGAVDGTGISRAANALVFGIQGTTTFGMFAGTAQFYGPLIMLTNKITQLGDGTGPTDALNLRTADARYLLPSNTGIRSIAESGAIGDGVAVDQPVIQTWLNSLAAGSEVTMPPGKWYRISGAPLVQPPHIVIRGAYNTRDNQLAGGSFLACGGFCIDPALPAGIIMCASSSLRNVKVYRYGMQAGMTNPANLSQAIADYTAWAAEGVYRKVTGLHASTDTVIPMANTSGISVGMVVTGLSTLVPSITGAWTPITVAAISPNISVTLSTAIGAATTSRAGRYLRFGSSLGVMFARNSAFITVDDCCIVGFRTGLQTTTGQYSIRRCVGDCITNIEITGGGSVGFVKECQWLPLYGAPPNALVGSFVRAGDVLFSHDATGTVLESCYGIGWQSGFHFENSNVQATNCFNEMPRGAGPNTENWIIRGGSSIALERCFAQAGSIGFHLDACNNFVLNACISQGSQLNPGDNVAHVLVENVRQLIPTTGSNFGHMAGSIVGLKTYGGYYSVDPGDGGYEANKLPVVFNQTTDLTNNGADGKGLINGCQLLGHYIQDIANPPVAPWISGSMPFSETAAFQQGIVYEGARTSGGTITSLAFWSGIIFDGAGTLATHTIVLPPYPVDGQTFDAYFNVAVTALTWQSGTGGTPALIGVYNNPSAGQHVRAIYELATNTWYFGGGTSSSLPGGPFLPLIGGTVTGPLTAPVSTSTVIAAGGTASRTLANRAADVFNVKDKGAVGDGVNDDTAEIQAAATAIPATGGVLYLPCGTYLVSASIVLKSNTTVRGDGPGTVVLAAAGLPAGNSIFRNVNNAVTVLTDSNITVRDLQIDFGAHTNDGVAKCISLVFVSNPQVLNVLGQCRGCGNHTALPGAYNSLVDGCIAYGFSNCAFDWWTTPRKARLTNCYGETASSAQMVNFNPENTTLGTSAGNVADGFIMTGNHFVYTGATACPIQIEPLETGTSVKNVIVANNIFENIRLCLRGAIRTGVVANNLFAAPLGGVEAIASYGQLSGTPTDLVIGNNNVSDPATAAGNIAVMRLGGNANAVVGNRVSGTAYGNTPAISTPGVNTVSEVFLNSISNQQLTGVLGKRFIRLMLHATSVGATPAIATTDGNAPGATNVFNIVGFYALLLRFRVVARSTGGATTTFVADNVLMTTTNVASAVTVSAVTFTQGASSGGSTTGYAITVTADTVNGGLACSCVGPAGPTIHWNVTVEGVVVQ